MVWPPNLSNRLETFDVEAFVKAFTEIYENENFYL